MYKVTHMTSAHNRDDVRIYHKECRSLQKAGYSVSIIVADGLGDADADGIAVYDVGRLSGRLNRMIKTTQNVFAKAVTLDSDIYHFHDPELIPAGLKLKQLGKKVIFDAHEDLPKQILSKQYLHPLIRRPLSAYFHTYEKRKCRLFDAIVAATPAIRDKFMGINKTAVDVNNFPLVSELHKAEASPEKSNCVVYAGMISEIRGIRELVSAMGKTAGDVRLNLAGKFNKDGLRDSVSQDPGWERVNELGQLSREDMHEVLAESRAGLVTFLPAPNHLDAQPNKMFEYMSAGIPVIASDFPMWREVIDSNQCGLLVDPSSPESIAKAIDYVIDNPEEAKKMGHNGFVAVLNKYNWDIQKDKLISIYEKILGKG